MNFNFGNLVSAAVGAVSKVANAVVNALSPVAKGGGLFGGIAGAVIGAAIAVANVCEDGEIDEDEIEEILANVVKAYVGACMAMFGSGSSGEESDDKSSNGENDVDNNQNTISYNIYNLSTYVPGWGEKPYSNNKNNSPAYIPGMGETPGIRYNNGDEVVVTTPNGKKFEASIGYGGQLQFKDEAGYKEAIESTLTTDGGRDKIIYVQVAYSVTSGYRAEGATMIAVNATHPDIGVFVTGGTGSGTPSGGGSIGLGSGYSENGFSGLKGESVVGGFSFGPLGVDHSSSSSSDTTSVSFNLGTSDFAPEAHVSMTNTVSVEEALQNEKEVLQDTYEKNKYQFEHDVNDFYNEILRKGGVPTN